MQQAVEDLKQENYDEARLKLIEAWKKGAHTPEKAYLLAQTYRSLLDYLKAKEYLEETLRLKPNLPQAQLMLADTLLALDRPKEAVPVLQALEPSGFEPGQMAYLRGMAESKEGNYSLALEYFRKAQNDPKMAQEAKFQASMALAALNRVKEARQTMEEAFTINTQTQTADFAKRYMGVLEKRLEELRPYHFSASFGFDYDTNVTLQPGGAGAATQVAGKKDIVYTQSASGDYTFFVGQPFSITTQYSYLQNFHRRLPTFDMLSHNVSVIPTYNYQAGRFFLPFSYNYVDVQSDKYYTGYLLTPAVIHLLNENIGVEAGGRLSRKYYWFPLTLPQDDRSARNLGGSLGMYYFFKKQTGFLQARFSYEHDYAGGSNWDCSSYHLLLAALYPATPKLKFNAFVDLLYQPYNNHFFNGDPTVSLDKREDKVLVTGLQATYEVLKRLEFNIHYFYTRDQSNVPIYNYKRHLVGCQLGFRY